MAAKNPDVGRWWASISLLALVGTLSLIGCDRTARLVPAGADSTAAIPADSTALYVQIARDRWQSPDDADEAAKLTARLLLDHLRAHAGDPPGSAAREFLDSLSIGAEVAGLDPAVVNLFSRSDPSGGSWPFLFWREQNVVRYEPLDASGLHLSGVSLEPVADPAGAAHRIAVLFTGSGPNGPQPFVFVWQWSTGNPPWRLVQSLGADSLGRTGSARFLEGGAALEARTYSVERGFDECASCPHVYRVRRFGWSTAGLVSQGSSDERTPYATFVQLIHALVAGDRASAQQLVTDPSLLSAADGYSWGTAKGKWRLAPGMAASSSELLLFRGSLEAYRVHFSPHGDGWVISGFEPTSRSVE